MGLFTPRERRDEEEPAGDAVVLALDVEATACPTCHRDLHPWQGTCPDDGAVAVPRTTLTRLAPPPAHLLDDPED